VSISFQCKSCGKKLKAPDSAAGSTSTCPGCGAKVTCPPAARAAAVVNMGPPSDEPSGFNPFADLDEDKPQRVAPPGPADEAETEPRRPCPACGEMILLTAAKCRFCGEVFDAVLKKSKGKKSGGKKAAIRSIATLQKYLLMSILVIILAYAAFFALGRPRGGPGPDAQVNPMSLILSLVVLVASLACAVLSVMLAYKLYGTGGAILVFVLQFIPCVSLVTLLRVNSKATNFLRDKGVTVGFLGADLSQFN
jgi:predicted RNA-binding Zn-ribbon protein involved in translation (DUF1610 family)